MAAASESRSTHSLFEVVGAYYVDTFFNHIYSTALTKASGGTSVTDAYRHNVQAYCIAVKNDKESYDRMVMDLHRNFRTQTSYATIAFADFVDKIVSTFVPGEYYSKMNNSQKDELLSSILCGVGTGLSTYVVRSDVLPRIIDSHEKQDVAMITIRMMQDHCVEVQRNIRSDIHSRFLRRAVQATNTVAPEIVDALKKKLKELLAEKAAMAARIAQMSGILTRLQAEVPRERAAFQKERTQLMAIIKALKSKLQSSAVPASVGYSPGLGAHDGGPPAATYDGDDAGTHEDDTRVGVEHTYEDDTDADTYKDDVDAGTYEDEDDADADTYEEDVVTGGAPADETSPFSADVSSVDFGNSAFGGILSAINDAAAEDDEKFWVNMN